MEYPLLRKYMQTIKNFQAAEMNSREKKLTFNSGSTAMQLLWATVTASVEAKSIIFTEWPQGTKTPKGGSKVLEAQSEA